MRLSTRKMLVRLILALSIMLVAALFFFEWLGSEQPQRRVEIEVSPGLPADKSGESAKN